MKQVQISDKAGRQIVVFDQEDATYPGGVQIDPTTAKARRHALSASHRWYV